MIERLTVQARKRWNAKRHLLEVAALGCWVCKQNGNEGTPAEIHHLRDGMGRGQRASDYETLPLCPIHHRTGDGTENSGGEIGFHFNEPKFEARYGTERELLEQIYLELGL